MPPTDWVSLTRQAEQLFDRQQLDEAGTLAERALRLNPNAASAHQVMGLIALERDRPLEAMPSLHRALALAPDLVHAHNGLGRCCFLLGDLNQALEHYNKALFLQPTYAYAHFNRSLVWLKQGCYREGWNEYEWRWPCGIVKKPNVPCPRWDGSPLAERSILVHTEQGIGDVLQFIRLLPLVKAQSARVVLACQKSLHVLLRSFPDVDEWFPIDEPGKISFTLYSPLLSLPGLLSIDEQNIPRDVPYISADPQRVERWAESIRRLPGFKVGLSWQGSPTFKTDALRSIQLEHFAPLAAIPSVSLVSLQKGPGVDQIALNRERIPLHTFDDLDRDAALVDSAAIMQHLDLVITSDTAIAHLAGALGRPVWVLLSLGCDWRWLLDRTDSPWYPTMRLFRQKTFGDWTGVFQEVAETLRAELSRGHRP